MSALPLPLERMQRWLQAVVVHPGSEQEAVHAPEAQREVPAERLGEVILPSPTLTPVQRVGIYHDMYLLRMREALAGDYPGLEHFLGDSGFLHLVHDYIQSHPSRSYTLNRLGDNLPGFVAVQADVPRREFCAELARLELAVTEVFDAPQREPLGPAEVASVPEGAWARARLTTIPAFRLMAFRYPVNAYLQSVRDEDHDHHPRARLTREWVTVYRHDYSVYRLELAKPGYDLLADLARGERLGDAVRAALRRPLRNRPTEDDLFRWFREWVSGGVFAEVRLD